MRNWTLSNPLLEPGPDSPLIGDHPSVKIDKLPRNRNLNYTAPIHIVRQAVMNINQVL